MRGGSTYQVLGSGCRFLGLSAVPSCCSSLDCLQAGTCKQTSQCVMQCLAGSPQDGAGSWPEGWGSARELLLSSQGSQLLLMGARAARFVSCTVSQPVTEHCWFGLRVDQGTHIKYWSHQFLQEASAVLGSSTANKGARG